MDNDALGGTEYLARGMALKKMRSKFQAQER